MRLGRETGTNQGKDVVIDTLQAAHEDHDDVVQLTQSLVQIPSRGGIDAYDPVLGHMAAWLGRHGLPCRRLPGPGGVTAALTCELTGKRPGPRYVLDACLDTAPFGDEKRWTYPPTSGEVNGGWLYGRGSSDSKAGAAIFAHVAARLQREADSFSGRVVLLLDADEHTGDFGGAKAYFEGPAAPGRVDGVMIGYPGTDHVITGGRGVLRVRLHVYGTSGHSGGSKANPGAIAKAAELIQALHHARLPGPSSPSFPLPARLTVTAIEGGEGYSTVPDVCAINVDVRLTPDFGGDAALELLRSAAASIDEAWPGTQLIRAEITTQWPPYALPAGSALRDALLHAAESAGLTPTAKVAGPSNIGNYLAGLGIPATAGFGVDYQGLHGTDEGIRLDSIPQVQAAYHQALRTLLRQS
jgi:succinyl-diaminopimelate desuccinylase